MGTGLQIITALFFLLLPAGTIYLAHHQRWAQRIGVIVLCYGLGLVLGLAGMVPGSVQSVPRVLSEATIVLALPLLALLVFFPGEPLWQWQGAGFYMTSGLALIALLGFFISLSHYDLSEFWGTKQWREGIETVNDQEVFHISPLHRYVRHPWYILLLVLIWTRDISSTQFTAYALVTLYLIIGSRLEERKLIAYHGEVYRQYQQKVAGLVPLPWKILSAAEATALIDKYKAARDREDA